MNRKPMHWAVLGGALLVAGMAYGQQPPPAPPGMSVPDAMFQPSAPPAGMYEPESYPSGPMCEGCDSYGDSCNGSCCSEGGCDICCEQPIEHFIYTRADAMFLTRDEPRSRVFTTFGPQGQPVLQTSDLEFDYEVLGRFLVGIPCCDCGAGLEASYFGLQNWEDDVTVTTPNPLVGNLFSVHSDFGTNPLTGFVDPNLQEGISYESDLHNAELNYVHRHSSCHCCWERSWVMGFRYFDLEEQFQYLTLGDPDVNAQDTSTRIQTDNNLIGFQLGVRTQRRISGKLRVEFEGKAGVFANLAEQTTDFSINNQLQFRDAERDDQIALVADAGVQLTYDLCCWLTLRGGYHVLYADGVALAPENFDPDLAERLLLTGQSNAILNANGNILYHGATAGLECRW